MRELRFDTGLVSYKVNDGPEITFNPGDVAFVKRFYDLMEVLTDKQDAVSKTDENADDVFTMTDKYDAEMRQDIDGLFGEGCADALFPNVSVFALAGGFPLWANFGMAIVDELDANLAREQQQGRERLDKYMKKYKSYKRK